jgi:adenine-specific DNA-methyltransferase
MSKEQRITGNITPPNKDLETLKKHFPQCFDKNGNFDFEKLKKQLSATEINFSKESYGMDWLGKSYARLLATDETTTLLKEDETFNQKEENKNSENLLIKGDNLEVLKHLSNAYYEKIKMIYIDPPYNTGSDGFVYADDRKFDVPTLMELAGISEERAKRILDFTQSNSNSHSAWLTFMYPRLYIAKQLLKEDGVIFVSIDDNEVAQLRLLMDEIFGEENFVESFIWRRRKTQANLSKHTAPVHDYILCYSKSKEYLNVNRIPYSKEFIKKTFKNPDKDPLGLYQTGPLARPANSSNREYELTMSNGRKITAKWSCSQQTFDKYVSENKLVIPRDGDGMPRKKIYLSELSGQIPNTWLDNIASNDEASKELESLFGTNATFSFPKPSKLIKHLLHISSNPDDLILDFFAGSGTTADAVMQLNAEDGGNRKFILAQLPEKIDPKKNKTAYDFVKNELNIAEPTIFEITKERLIRASKKINAELDEKTKNLKLKIKKLQGELSTEETKAEIQKLQAQITKNSQLKTHNYFKIFETMPIWEDYNFEADELDAQQIQLFDESKLTQEDIKALLVTWKTYDGVSLSQSLQDIDLTDYTAYYSNGKLYLMDKGFKTKNLKTLLEKIDSDKDFNPTTIIAFGYHFDSKNLREISENIKSYANKKSIDIDFITRY